MPNAKYQLTNKAVDDLTGIWDYSYSTWSEQQADKYYREILARCQELAEHPESGTTYVGFDVDLKSARVNRHIIFYRRIDRILIEVVRILHERMDLDRRMDKWT